MNLSIKHLSEYAYSSPVNLHPHFFRMSPLLYPHIDLKTFSINSFPTPAGSAWIMDQENNKTLHSWYVGETGSLRVETSIELSTRPYNPFAFVYFPLSSFDLSSLLSTQWSNSFAPFLSTETLSDELITLLEDLKQTCKGSSEFVQALAQQIGQECSSEPREKGAPLSAAITWAKREGSCRDLSWLMIQLARTSGIPARFTSGYHFAPGLNDHELHAWVEVYLPGGGWVGLDPSTGFPVDQAYIPVACSANPESTLPVEGAYSGNATAVLTTSVTIEAV